MDDSRPSRRALWRLRRALYTMPERPRAVFDLHRFGDRDYAQIADELGIELAEVERAMADAMVHLDRKTGPHRNVARFGAWLRRRFGRFWRR
ncbi:sigma-70 region 4 domain-containing protein [Sphingomonas sp. ZT3P38]|uniref:sigma-70 region 4 domain-containing protein n=1 Tax=Parasphingomonas zepuensis TaxID=3096161 RepID=UPI002FC84D2A